MNQIIFNGKKNYTDLNIMLVSFSIQSPSKKKIKVPVPFMSGSYDFSTVGSNGEIIYDERTIKAKFDLKSSNRGSLYNKYSEVLEWLIGVGQNELIVTDMSDYYYLAEVENAPSFEETVRHAGIMEVEFVAYPFKYGVDLVGDDVWDTFNFLEDIVQVNQFNVVSTSTVSIYNSKRLVIPTINCNVAMSLVFEGITYSLVAGDNKIYGLKFKNGYNSIKINGTGIIKFLFRKVAL